MSEASDVLWLRVLLCFQSKDTKMQTVTGIAHTLNEKKYTVSRILIAMEKDGLLDRRDERSPKLTEKGQAEMERYAERVRVALNHLLYEGVNIESAKQDAMRWALYNSEDTDRVLRNSDEIYRVKYELRGKKTISGSELFKMFGDGVYTFPFTFYRVKAKNGELVSMADDAFEHPCFLTVRNGIGTIQLHAVSMTGISASTGKMMSGKIQTMKYWDHGEYIGAESRGDVLSFPAAPMKFKNMGANLQQTLDGTLFMKMKCSVGVLHMPEAEAVFTMKIQ